MPLLLLLLVRTWVWMLIRSWDVRARVWGDYAGAEVGEAGGGVVIVVVVMGEEILEILEGKDGEEEMRHSRERPRWAEAGGRKEVRSEPVQLEHSVRGMLARVEPSSVSDETRASSAKA